MSSKAVRGGITIDKPLASHTAEITILFNDALSQWNMNMGHWRYNSDKRRPMYLEKTEVLAVIRGQCHFVHHKSHTKRTGTETDPSRWEVGYRPLAPCHGDCFDTEFLLVQYDSRLGPISRCSEFLSVQYDSTLGLLICRWFELLLVQYDSRHGPISRCSEFLSVQYDSTLGLLISRCFPNLHWHKWKDVWDGEANHRKPCVIGSADNQARSALLTLLCDYSLLLWNCSYPRTQGHCHRPVFLHSTSSELPRKHVTRVTDHRCNTGLAMNDVLQKHVSSVPG
jgi:hypothetical protein